MFYFFTQSNLNLRAASEYGLFLSDEDNKQGVWLESGRNLGYYLLRNHDILEYRRKLRTLRVRMLDGAVKTILVDDSQPVSQLMVVICTKIGITNHEEYGLVREEFEQQNENLPDNKTGTLTLRRRFAEKDRDAKMESLRKKLKTDDESETLLFSVKFLHKLNKYFFPRTQLIGWMLVKLYANRASTNPKRCCCGENFSSPIRISIRGTRYN